MKLFDCTTFYSEHLMMDIRFNILNEKVHKFVVVESKFSHSGKEKKLNFDIDNYKKFKDKIIYLVIDKEPKDLLKIENTSESAGIQRSNSLKRIEQSYETIQKGIANAEENDLILLSDNDEIPNLDSKIFTKNKKDIIIFRQLFFYYKFNLLNDEMFWYGTKACKKKKLISMPWLKNIKNKKYPFWRFDTFFSNKKYTNLEIIEDGGWHFTNLKSPEELLEKMKNFGHHNEFEKSGLGLEDLRKKIETHELFYDHTLDQSDPKKWESNHKLKKTELNILPRYIQENISNLKDWLA